MDPTKTRATDTQVLDCEERNFAYLVEAVLNNEKCEGRVAVGCSGDISIHQLLYMRREGDVVKFYFDSLLKETISITEPKDVEHNMVLWCINQVTVYNEAGDAKLYFSN